LSEWIRNLELASLESKLHETDYEAKESAVRQIGTNAVPFLIRWLDCGSDPRPSKLDAMMVRLGPKAGFVWHEFRWRRAARSRDALHAFQILGPEAGPAVPKLVQIMRQPGLGGEFGVFVLDYIGKDAVPVLIDELTIRLAYISNATAALCSTMQHLGTNGLRVVPVLVGCLTNADFEVAATAATLVGGESGFMNYDL
jgi:hypothetical protein